MKITRVLHVSLNASDGSLEETRQWYADVLGLPAITTRPEIPGVPGHWLDAGGTQLHLVGAPPSQQEIDPTGPHWCLGVPDIEAAVAELEQRNIPYRRAFQGEGVVQIWVRDPSGATLELQQDACQ